MSGPQRRCAGDRGAVLPLVLLFVVALGLVVAGTTRYAGTNLRYSTVVRDRTAANAAAEAELRYAIARLRTNSVTTCDNGPVRIVPTHTATVNGATSTVTCDRLDGGQATLAGWAAVATGIGMPVGQREIWIEEEGIHAATGRMFVDGIRQAEFEIRIQDVEFHGDIFYDGTGDDCATIEEYNDYSVYDDDIVMIGSSLVCWTQSWDDVFDPPPLAALPTKQATSPAHTDVNGCRVFEPGWYHSTPFLDLHYGGDNYFKSGAYVFEDVVVDTGQGAVETTRILAGYPPDATYDNRLILDGPCQAAQAADAPVSPGDPVGVTWYFGGSSRLFIDEHASIEMIPMLIDDGIREHPVSIHVLGPGSPKPSTLAAGVRSIDESSSNSYAHNHALFQGQIWSPTQPIDLEDMEYTAGDGQVTSGVVAAQIRIDSNNGSIGPLGPDRTATDHRLLLTSVATVGNVTAEARAIVAYRPNAQIDDRVAVESFRYVG